MPVNKSALKRERQNKVRRERNRILKSKVHTAFIKLESAINSKDEGEVENRLRIYTSEVDKAVKRKVFHVNKGARKKARIAKKIKGVFSERKSA
ncbi:MAG: 30S ribosomal protein S20 [Spirochaetes bacterium]|nr:30S ribosomal protein S20 [Spirochaetota bacterium]